MESKKYGLIIPKKEKKEIISKINLFSTDKSDDESLISNAPKLTSISYKEKFLKKQTKLNIEKALNEDPNCFEYDDVYDDIQSKKFSLKAKIINDKKPKYIENLIKTAQERKKEYERRVERQVQKDRDAEKGMYDDKESYVTDAYRKKMQMLKEEEELERRKQMLEEQNDVTKKSDFSEFYRHILDQQTSTNSPNPINNEPQIKQELLEPNSDRFIIRPSQNPISKKSQNESILNNKEPSTSESKHQMDGNKNYNLDADDSDVDDDISSDSDDSLDNNSSLEVSNKTSNPVIDENLDSLKTSKIPIDDNLKLNNTDTSMESKPKHDKKTVGETLSDARARYLARKNSTYVPLHNDN